MKKGSLSMNVKIFLKNGAWIFLIAMSIESFTFKIPYLVVLGVYFMITSFIFFPWLDKICNLIGIKLNIKNKWFIGVVNLFIAAYLINPKEASYYKCILPIVLMILTWIITIFYSKQKNRD